MCCVWLFNQTIWYECGILSIFKLSFSTFLVDPTFSILPPSMRIQSFLDPVSVTQVLKMLVLLHSESVDF